MPLNFPNSPALNQEYTVGTRTWVWNGAAWKLKSKIGTSGYSGESGYSGYSGHSGYSGVVAAAGSNTQVQYNSSNALAGSSNFTFDGTSASSQAFIANNGLFINSNTVSTS